MDYGVCIPPLGRLSCPNQPLSWRVEILCGQGRNSDSISLFLFQLWESTKCQVASAAQGGRRVHWALRHCGLHGYQVRLEGPQHGAQAGREMLEHGVLRACSHPRGFRRPHICAPSSFPSWVSISPLPVVTKIKCPYLAPNLLIGRYTDPSYSKLCIRGRNKRNWWLLPCLQPSGYAVHSQTLEHLFSVNTAFKHEIPIYLWEVCTNLRVYAPQWGIGALCREIHFGGQLSPKECFGCLKGHTELSIKLSVKMWGICGPFGLTFVAYWLI
jgi:hypothetical protein